MDAVELPLPVNVLVDKIMASDGLERGGEVMGRSPAGKGASVLQKGSGCGASRVEYASPPRYNKVDDDSCVHENMASSAQYEDNSRRHQIEETDGHSQLSPIHEGKLLGRKSAKKQVIIPYKRLRNDETENFKKNAAHEVVLNDVGFDSRKCTFDDKSLIIKQKRVHDGKRTDKKNFRSSMKNKYECLTSRAGLVCNDAFASGNAIFGTHGLKSDVHDAAKHLDELSISELLDGSYKYLKLPVDKGKKSSVLNDSILSSVRNACSILCISSLGAVENSSNVKASQSSQNPSFSTGSDSDCEVKDKQLEESLANVKAQNSSQGSWLGFDVLQPKNIMDRLTLPATQELEGTLLNSSVGTMLPYPWSFSHGGNSRPFEFCKVNSTKNTCQGKWVRIGCINTFIEDNKSFLNGCISKYGSDEDAISQQKINEVLQELKFFTSSFQFPFECKTTCVMGNHHENGLKDHTSEGSTASEVVLRCKGKAVSIDSAKVNLSFKYEAVLRKCSTGSSCSASGCSCRIMITGCSSISEPSSSWDKYGQDFSADELSAAITLSEMSSCSDSLKTSNTTNGRIRWPKVPSSRPMKARKSLPSLDKPDRTSSADARRHDSNKQASTPYSKHHSSCDTRNDFRWPSIPVGDSSSPNKSEKDLIHGLPHEISSFRPSLLPLSSRADKAYDKQIRKLPVRPPSSFEGSSIKDWIRGRSKKRL